jgi:hypothetical protein
MFLTNTRSLVPVAALAVAIGFGGRAPSAAAEPPAPADEPVTDAMRAALEKVRKAHAGMERKAVDEAVTELHREVGRHDPRVFVPLAVPHLMRLAPHDTATRVLLRKALAEKWLDEFPARMYLVQSGDSPGPHLEAMLEAVGGSDRQARRAALAALAGVGTAGADALPALRDIIDRAKADPADYRRAYTAGQEVPDHVLARLAIDRIEADAKAPAGPPPRERPAGRPGRWRGAGAADSGRYTAYWLTRDPPDPKSNEYEPVLLLARYPLEAIAAAPKLSGAEAPEGPRDKKAPPEPTPVEAIDAPAITVETYQKDSIWAPNMHPFNPVRSVRDFRPEARRITVNGNRYRYEDCPIRDVVHLLEHPEGTLPVHRVVEFPLRPQPQTARALILLLKEQLAAEGKEAPGAPK